MPTFLSILVLTAGTLAPVQPAGQAAKSPAGPAAAQVQPSGSMEDLLEFTDASLIPAWAVKPQDRNAAVGYLKAAIDFPRDTREAAGEVNWDEVGANLDPAKMPASYAKAVKTLRDGSRQWVFLCLESASRSRCDFENSYEGGVGMLLPHLGHLRALVRGLRVEARQLAIEGKKDQAAKIVAAILRMGEHVSRDRILISTLVGVAIGRAGVAETQALLASGDLSDQARADLHAAIAAVLTPDPFAARGALDNERDMFLEWFKIAVQKSDKAPHLVAGLLGQKPNSELEQQIAALKGDKLDAEVDRAREAFAEVLKAWGTPDTAAKLLVVEKRVQQGDFGIIAQIAMPSFGTAWKNCGETTETLRALDAQLVTK